MWSLPALSAQQAMWVHGGLEWVGMALGAFLWRRSAGDGQKSAMAPHGFAPRKNTNH